MIDATAERDDPRQPGLDQQLVRDGGPGGHRSRVARLGSAVGHRWPSGLALAMSAATWGVGESGDAVANLSEALLLLPLLYLIVAAVRRRWASWPVLATLLAAMIGLRQQDSVAPAAVLVLAALGLLVWGALRRPVRQSPMFRLQAVGMVGFGALCLVGLAIDPDVGRYIVAAAWFGHGVWDVVHLRADGVVSRSFAEWCAVIDVVIAVELAFRL